MRGKIIIRLSCSSCIASASPPDGVTSQCFEDAHSQKRHSRCKCSFVQRDGEKRGMNVIYFGDIRRSEDSRQSEETTTGAASSS